MKSRVRCSPIVRLESLGRGRGYSCVFRSVQLPSDVTGERNGTPPAQLSSSHHLSVEAAANSGGSQLEYGHLDLAWPPRVAGVTTPRDLSLPPGIMFVNSSAAQLD
jgi:hypothetical protein